MMIDTTVCLILTLKLNITCNMSFAMRYKETAQVLSLTELKSCLFQLYFIFQETVHSILSPLHLSFQAWMFMFEPYRHIRRWESLGIAAVWLSCSLCFFSFQTGLSFAIADIAWTMGGRILMLACPVIVETLMYLYSLCVDKTVSHQNSSKLKSFLYLSIYLSIYIYIYMATLLIHLTTGLYQSYLSCQNPLKQYI